MITLVSAVLVVVGLAGIVVPVLPGLVLIWAGVLVWTLSLRTPLAWTVLAVATVVMAVGSVVRYLVPGRQLRGSGVPWSTMALGTLLGVIGFFVVPVAGLVIGFVLGVYLAERARLREHSPAWTSTLAALRAAGWSMVIELMTGLVIALTWLAGVLLA